MSIIEAESHGVMCYRASMGMRRQKGQKGKKGKEGRRRERKRERGRINGII